MIEIIKAAEAEYQYNTVSNACCDCSSGDADAKGF